ncbi:hypothetical protein PAAG_12086 [Paracoccidioides lutzii Pb01]|uniref:Uncharacterized protein n=1 Tax=Paracoccidioides lutzii (strain ATCC MYA-826 / Pb01) TaxID=502779 RepID=A0A0A2V176_PARBA|nr:hypothetical protein PAAG_12086 [Paracoccidioides lutzii Pb01]KGQ01228.1 hypothetical protein PAAG_12086 [Paracoccidioides lutzii Pb01]
MTYILAYTCPKGSLEGKVAIVTALHLGLEKLSPGRLLKVPISYLKTLQLMLGERVVQNMDVKDAPGRANAVLPES